MYKMYYEMWVDYVFRHEFYPKIVLFCRCKHATILKCERNTKYKVLPVPSISDTALLTEVMIHHALFSSNMLLWIINIAYKSNINRLSRTDQILLHFIMLCTTIRGIIVQLTIYKRLFSSHMHTHFTLRTLTLVWMVTARTIITNLSTKH